MYIELMNKHGTTFTPGKRKKSVVKNFIKKKKKT